jgi:hypothetical protein
VSPSFDDPYFDSFRKWVLPAGPKEGRDPVGVTREYIAMRSRVFATSPADLGLVPTERLPRVWAVLVDLPSERVTVVCVADGTTSLYATGGGVISGDGTMAALTDAATRLLDTAERALGGLPAGTSIGLPARGSAAFTVFTYDGMRRVEVAESEALGPAVGAVQDLYAATREVVTELRQANETKRGAGHVSGR